MTFPDEQFDLILSFEVMEHVPNYCKAFGECARTLKPGGKMLFSAPFDANAALNRIRARLLQMATVEHILPPECHGDPLNAEGCLAFSISLGDAAASERQASPGFGLSSITRAHSMDIWEMSRFNFSSRKKPTRKRESGADSLLGSSFIALTSSTSRAFDAEIMQERESVSYCR